jgi:hypothetical protein
MEDGDEEEDDEGEALSDIARRAGVIMTRSRFLIWIAITLYRDGRIAPPNPPAIVLPGQIKGQNLSNVVDENDLPLTLCFCTHQPTQRIISGLSDIGHLQE